MRMAIVLMTLLLAPSLAAAAEQLEVNVVTARSMGCSPDSFTQPDLRVRVFLDDRLVHETFEANDNDAPLFALLSLHSVTLPATLGIEVEEGEPGGFFGLGATRWVPCDAAPGPARRLNVTVTEATQRIVARGDDAQAAEAVVVAGIGAPPPATLRVVNVTATQATLSWTGDPFATAHRLARTRAGEVLAVAGPGDATATLTSLCDNQAYAVRLIRDQDPWSVEGPEVSFTTDNVAPAPPRILSSDAAGSGTTNLTWETPDAHDVATFEVHAAPTASFTPSAETFRASTTPSFFMPQSADNVPLQAGDAFVRVRATDTGGLAADSPALRLGLSQPSVSAGPPDCGRIGGVTVDGGGAPVQVSTAPTGPTATDPPPTTTTPRGEAQDVAPERASPPSGFGGVSWGILLAVALGAAALGGVLVLALRR